MNGRLRITENKEPRLLLVRSVLTLSLEVGRYWMMYMQLNQRNNYRAYQWIFCCLAEDLSIGSFVCDKCVCGAVVE